VWGTFWRQRHHGQDIVSCDNSNAITIFYYIARQFWVGWLPGALASRVCFYFLPNFYRPIFYYKGLKNTVIIIIIIIIIVPVIMTPGHISVQ